MHHIIQWNMSNTFVTYLMHEKYHRYEPNNHQATGVRSMFLRPVAMEHAAYWKHKGAEIMCNFR